MKINIQYKIILALVFMFMLGNQLSYGKFKFPPNDSLYKQHTLNGHKFIVSSLIGTPFIQTFLQTRVGAAKTIDLEIPTIKIDTQTFSEIRGDLVYSNLDVEYQQTIREWMAFRVRLMVIGKLGTKAGALISQGVNVGYGYELGWLIKLYRNKKLAVSGSLDLSNTSYTLINLQKFIEGIIDSGRVVISNELVRSVPALKFGVSLRGSYAFNKTYGFTANINARYGETLDKAANSRLFFEFGGIFDTDLMPRQKIPIGFMLGFYHNELPTATEEIVSNPNNFLFGINFTGRQDLNLGLEANYQFYKPTGFEDNIKLVTFTMNFRYFF